MFNLAEPRPVLFFFADPGGEVGGGWWAVHAAFPPVAEWSAVCLASGAPTEVPLVLHCVFAVCFFPRLSSAHLSSFHLFRASPSPPLQLFPLQGLRHEGTGRDGI